MYEEAKIIKENATMMMNENDYTEEENMSNIELYS